MKSQSRKMLAAFVAVCAFAAVASASASAALPEFVPKAGSKGETFPLALEDSFNSTVTFASEGEKWIQCTHYSLKGSITAAKTASLTSTLEGCELTGAEHERCTTEGAGSEGSTIVLSGTGSLVYLKKSTKQVGIVVSVGKHTVFCGGGANEESFKGSIISPITPVNTETTKPEMQYHAKNSEEDEFTKYENEKGELISAPFEWNNGGGAHPGSLNVEGTIKVTTPRGLTIKA